MRVLLTGHTGLLGRKLYSLLRNNEHEVICVGRHQTDHASCVAVDFESPNLFETLASLPACDAIIHLASYISFDPQVPESAFFGSTLNATMAFIHLAKKWQAAFIFASTVSVYETLPFITQETAIAPQSAYARTKWLAENLICSADLPTYSIFRLPGIYGLTSLFHMGLNKFIAQALQDNCPPTVYGDGAGLRNYIYAGDAAQAILTAMQQSIKGTFLLGGAETLSIKAMAEAICTHYLPGKKPIFSNSTSPNTDMIIERSAHFPGQYSFSAALKEMADEFKRGL